LSGGDSKKSEAQGVSDFGVGNESNLSKVSGGDSKKSEAQGVSDFGFESK